MDDDDDMQFIGEVIKTPEKMKSESSALNSVSAVDVWGETKCIFCSKNLVECASDPRLLPCLHAACNDCVKQKLNNGLVPCCGCNQSCNVADVIDHQFVFELKQDDSDDSNKNITCSCDDNAQVSSYCNDCQDWLCDQCVSAHQRVRFTKDHVIKTKAEIDVSDKDGQNSGPKYMPCPTHKQELLKLYCESCEKLTCRDCQLMEHKDHKYQFLSTISQQYKSFLSTLLTKIKEKSSYIENAQELVKKRQSEILDREEEVTKEIKMFAVQIITLINQRGKQLLQELHDTCEKKKEQLVAKNDELVNLSLKLDHCLKFASSAVKESSDSALVYSKKLITNQLRLVLHKRCEVPNPQHVVDIRFLYDNKYLPDYINKVGQIMVDQQGHNNTGANAGTGPANRTVNHSRPANAVHHQNAQYQAKGGTQQPQQHSSPQRRQNPIQLNYNARPQRPAGQTYQQTRAMNPRMVQAQQNAKGVMRPRHPAVNVARGNPVRQSLQQRAQMPQQQRAQMPQQHNQFKQSNDTAVRILNVQSLQSRNRQQPSQQQQAQSQQPVGPPKVISVTSMSNNNQQQQAMSPHMRPSVSMSQQRSSHYAQQHPSGQVRPQSQQNQQMQPRVMNANHGIRRMAPNPDSAASVSMATMRPTRPDARYELDWFRNYNAAMQTNGPTRPQPPPLAVPQPNVVMPTRPASNPNTSSAAPVDDKAAVRAAIEKMKQDALAKSMQAAPKPTPAPDPSFDLSKVKQEKVEQAAKAAEAPPKVDLSKVKKERVEKPQTQQEAPKPAASTEEVVDRKPVLGPGGQVVTSVAPAVVKQQTLSSCSQSSGRPPAAAIALPTVAGANLNPGFPAAIPNIPSITAASSPAMASASIPAPISTQVSISAATSTLGPGPATVLISALVSGQATATISAPVGAQGQLSTPVRGLAPGLAPISTHTPARVPAPAYSQASALTHTPMRAPMPVSSHTSIGASAQDHKPVRAPIPALVPIAISTRAPVPHQVTNQLSPHTSFAPIQNSALIQAAFPPSRPLRSDQFVSPTSNYPCNSPVRPQSLPPSPSYSPHMAASRPPLPYGPVPMANGPPEQSVPAWTNPPAPTQYIPGCVNQSFQMDSPSNSLMDFLMPDDVPGPNDADTSIASRLAQSSANEEPDNIECAINVLQSMCSEISQPTPEPVQGPIPEQSGELVKAAEAVKPPTPNYEHLVDQKMKERQLNVAIFDVCTRILKEFDFGSGSLVITKMTRREMRRRERVFRKALKLQKVRRKRGHKSAKEDSDNSDNEEASRKKQSRYEDDPDWNGLEDDFVEAPRKPTPSSRGTKFKKRKIQSVHHRLNAMIFAALQTDHNNGLELNKQIVFDKAKQLSEDLGVEKFMCNDTWFEKFSATFDVSSLLGTGTTGPDPKQVFSVISFQTDPASSSNTTSVSFFPVETSKTSSPEVKGPP